MDTVKESPSRDAVTAPETRIVKGIDAVAEQLFSLILRAAADKEAPSIYATLDRFGPLILPAYFGIIGDSKRKHPQLHLRAVIDIQRENMAHVKEMIKAGTEVRHSEGNIRKFVFSRSEAAETSHSLENGQPEEIVWSTNADFVGQLAQVFQLLWEKGVPAKERFREIEEGVLPSQTLVLQSSREIVDRITLACNSSSKSLCFCTSDGFMELGFKLLLPAYKKALPSLAQQQRNHPFLRDSTPAQLAPAASSFRWIVSMQDPKLLPVLRQLTKLGVSVRHSELPFPIQFGIKDSEELFATLEARNTEPEGFGTKVLFSDELAYVTQFHSLFEELWNKAVDPERRILELEKGLAHRKTEVVHGMENTITSSLEVFRNSEQFFHALSDSSAPSLGVNVTAYKNAYLDLRKRGVEVKVITEITKENLSYCKQLLALGMVSELRHMDGVKGNFAVSENEYVASSVLQESKGPPELIRSNQEEILSQNQYVFDTLWSKAVPAEQRIRQLEHGLDLGYTTLTYDTQEILKAFHSFVGETRHEALITVPTLAAVKNVLSLFQQLAFKAREKGVRVRVLLPASFSPDMPSAIEKLVAEQGLQGLEFRVADTISANFSFGIYDKEKMILAHYIEPDSAATAGASAWLTGTITTNRETVDGVASIFEALWHESEVREREEKNRKKAELLQDILTHDIRNYNQITKLSAELLQDELRDQEGVQSLLHSLIQAVEGSTSLLERAKKLGKVISEDNPNLYPVDLGKTLEGSLKLVRLAYADRAIRSAALYPRATREEKWLRKPDNALYVIADDLLGEAFANLYSNCVRYSLGEDKEVFIETKVENEADRTGEMFWKISVTDHGRGIPEDQKPLLFKRYLRAAKGSGLGMSIVHALVVDRYRGKISIQNRVAEDFTKGTLVQIWLPKVRASTIEHKSAP